jgi:hypothetical protein
MSNVTCQIGDLDLSSCRYTPAPTNCTHAQDVVLTCAGRRWQYRIVDQSTGSTATLIGRFEARPNSSAPWGAVCVNAITPAAASVACASVFAGSVAWYNSTTSSTASRPIYFTQPLNCNGLESSLDRCPTSSATLGKCSPGVADLLIACVAATYPTDVAWQFRLSGHSSTSGRLEVRPNALLPWGTVCSRVDSAALGNVACSALGFDSSFTQGLIFNSNVSWITPSDIQQPTYISNVSCLGTESNPSSCAVTQRGFCNGTTPVGLSCVASTFQYRLTGGNVSYGRVEVRKDAFSPWGTICASPWSDQNAQVICRSLDLPVTGAKMVNAPQSTSIGNVAWGATCGGNETRLDFCTSFTLSTRTCTSRFAAVVCGEPAARWQYRLTGESPTAGRLEMRPNSSAAYGTACFGGFTAAAAAVACTALGFDITSTTPTFSQSRFSPAGIAKSTAPIYFGNLNCKGTENRLELCAFSVNSSCTHFDDVRLSCQPIQKSSWEYGVVGSSNRSGILITRPDPISNPGTVCSEGFDSAAAAVACSSLGFPAESTVATFYESNAEQPDSIPIWMSNLDCTGTEASLDECLFTTSDELHCSHLQDVVLECTASQKLATSISLSLVEERHGRGLVQVRFASTGQTGLICESRPDPWSSANVAAACRSLGFSGENAESYTPDIKTSAAFLMDAVSCVSSDSTLQTCSYVPPTASRICPR